MNEVGRKGISRRAWLGRMFTWGGVTAALALLGGMILDVLWAAARFTPYHWRDAGPVAGFPPGQATPLPELRVAILRRGDRLAALSLVCPHLGCLVNTVDRGFFCPCHGSQFGPFGELYSGPATRPLGWQRIRISRGRLQVLGGRRLEQPVWLTMGAGGEGGG